jgi:hypothetical protein
MTTHPRSIDTVKAHRYGTWAGNPKGHAYDPTLCAEEVWPQGQWISRQCSRKRSKTSIYCKQHAPKLDTHLITVEEK